MNGLTRTPRFDANRRLWLGLMSLGLVFWGWNLAEGSAIHHRHDSEEWDRGSNARWSEDVTDGPHAWRDDDHPRLTRAVEAWMCTNIRTRPLMEANEHHELFLYNLSMDPPWFDDHHHHRQCDHDYDHHHPKISRSVTKCDAKVDDSKKKTTTTTTTTSSPTDQSQQIMPTCSSMAPSTVPEPSTLLLTIGMTGYALWWRRRRI
jgi:hypothetical protein